MTPGLFHHRLRLGNEVGEWDGMGDEFEMVVVRGGGGRDLQVLNQATLPDLLVPCFGT